MSHSIQFPRPSRRRFMAVLLIAAAAVVMLLAIQGPAARAEIDSGCVSGKFCIFTGTFYTGEEFNEGCGSSGATTFELRSAKNHCTMNIRIGWSEGGSTNWKACMTPGGERPEPGRFNKWQSFGC
jgi:hypothetical protein